jgi:hypothetical protein
MARDTLKKDLVVVGLIHVLRKLWKSIYGSLAENTSEIVHHVDFVRKGPAGILERPFVVEMNHSHVCASLVRSAIYSKPARRQLTKPVTPHDDNVRVTTTVVQRPAVTHISICSPLTTS